MIKRQHIVPEFFAEAEAMREALDACFKDAYDHKIHWQYFCDPRRYTYLRTTPQGVFPQAVLERFLQHLRQWCMQSLGLVPMGVPKLHLMVNGCRLGLHSDFHNGAWGYVYSLTRWQERRFSGGETLLMRDGIPSYKRHHAQDDSLYELIPAIFNQLLIFDDRIVHATPPIEGSMDPLEGRIALVGHIRASSPQVSGSLPPTVVRKVILDAMVQLRERVRTYKDVQGTVTYELTIGTTGTVESATSLTDNIITPATGYAHSDAVAAVRLITQQAMSGLKFPASMGRSTVIVPVLIPLPDLRPIEWVIAHNMPRGVLRTWAQSRLGSVAGLELQGAWEGEGEGETFVVREPVAGNIRIEAGQISACFDPPMWVPSQRENFQIALSAWLQSASASVDMEVDLPQQQCAPERGPARVNS